MDHQLTSARASDNAKKRVTSCYANRCGEFQPLNSLIHRASGIDGAKRISRWKFPREPNTPLKIRPFSS